MKANIQAYVTAMNAEKGDTILGSFDSAKDYFTYNLPARDVMPNRKAFFLQTIENPDVVSIQGASAYLAQVGIDVVVNMTNDGKDERRMLRYNRIIKDIVDNLISPEYKGVTVRNAGMTQVEDAKKVGWLISTVYLTASIP